MTNKKTPNDGDILGIFIKECNDALLLTEDGQVTLSYFQKERGLSLETIKKHRLGFCHPQKDITNVLENIFKDSEKKVDNPYSYYRINDNLIVPVYSEFGSVIAFATRRPFKSNDGWWNSPFPKGSNLYMLNDARKYIFEKNKVYLVEGYMDALTLHQAGLKNVVAIMGTKLTLRNMGLIARYCNNICLCMDVDVNKSGQKAVSKIISDLYSIGLCDKISIVDDLPEGLDPDEYVLKFGIDKFLSMEKVLSRKELLKRVKQYKKNA